MPILKIFNSIKEIFIKEETFPCIIWNGKTMSYMHLTKKKIDEINTSDEYEDWSVTINEKEQEIK